MTLVVGAASLDDVVQLHGLIRDHAAFERGTASLTVSDLETIIGSGRASIRLLVAKDASVLLGYAALTFDWSLWRARRYGHLDCLFVADGVRGEGVGAKILEEAIQLVSGEGVGRLKWQTPAWNGNATRFYLRHGAESADKKRFALTIRPSPRQPFSS